MDFIDVIGIVGIVIAFGMSFAIGANDVANGSLPFSFLLTKFP
jgi:phosphate/sulfate permease